MIAILAGKGMLPVEAARIFIHAEKEFMVIALFDEDNGTALRAVAGETRVITQEFYKPGNILSLLKEHQVTSMLLIGKVDKRHLLGKLKLDWLAIKMLAKVATKSDTSLMEAVVANIEEEGIEVLSQQNVLKELCVTPGVLTGSLDEEVQKSIMLGMKTAVHLSEGDVGQTVVVKDTMVVALEAIEGTDECIKRGIALAKGGVIICKAARANQDKKFDLPTLGPDTLEFINPGEVSAIAWQSSQTFIVERERFVAEARKRGITLIAV